MAKNGRIDAYLVCGGKWHDFDFARLELLKLLAENDNIRVRVGPDYRDVEAIAACDFLITYTCDIRATPDEERVLRDFVASGKRWFALHGTNSAFEFREGGVDSIRIMPTLMDTLGSRFIAHPPIMKYRVSVADPTSPLVAGIEPFDTDDELYLCEYHGQITPLLETRYTGPAEGFIEKDWPEDKPRLVEYLHPVAAGEVLYLTLGHCRGKYDMQPLVALCSTVERGSWKVPQYYELLRRGIAWASRAQPQALS
jgi:type 1 glutamine amidotransferase